MGMGSHIPEAHTLSNIALPLAIGDEVESTTDFPGRGIVTEAPATVAGGVVPGWIRVMQGQGFTAHDTVGSAKNWRRVKR